MMKNHKRQSESSSDLNNNEIIQPTKKKATVNADNRNFSIRFYPAHMQIITGANGSGKSTIANAICLCLGAQARTTGRTSNVQSFIQNGERSAQLTITLANEGPEAFKPELYGKEIQIVRRIGSRKSGYKVLGANRQVISTRKETIDEIIQALSISPENPLCILHQEIAKTFLLTSDPNKKYQFYMKVSQLDQIKQAYEQGVCTVNLLTQRVNNMKQKHSILLRQVELLEREVRKIEFRRHCEEKRRLLEAELIAARADQARQELFEAQYELDQIQTVKDVVDAQTTENNNQILEIDRRIECYLIEKADFEKDTYGLNELLSYFSKQQQTIHPRIHSLTLECEKYRKILTEMELEQIYVQKQIDKYESSSQQSEDINEQRLRIDQEISIAEEKQVELDRILTSLRTEICINDENIQEKQTLFDSLKNELKQKRQNLDELNTIYRNKEDAYGVWMSDCLKAIQNDDRFHKKPIGPIGYYIHCIDSHWSYAVEKHLAPIMSSFICTSNHDEKILLEILSSFSIGRRPPIYVRAFSDNVHDVSGTLKQIREANLLAMYDVLKIDNANVECILIDVKQIEATILIENFEKVKELKQSQKLSWEKIDKKVKQVAEAWTFDGSNIKFDKTSRIYTNEKQPIRYFLTTNIQPLSKEELEADIKSSSRQLEEVIISINELKANGKRMKNEMNECNKEIIINKKKIEELMKGLDHLNATMPVVIDCSLTELQGKVKALVDSYNEAVAKYTETKEEKDECLRQLADITENYENTIKRIDFKTRQYDILIEKLNYEQTSRFEIKRKLKTLKRKSKQININLRKQRRKLNQLNKKLSKKSRSSTIIIRSVLEIQNELDGINNYLKAHEDTNEERREIINQFRTQREAAKEYKQTYERCYRQIEHVKQFINKRQEGFLTIAEQHQYYLRIKFQNLMKKYDYDDCEIQIDHKKETLEIIVKKHQRDPASLSSGERSISTFCFLLALWQSIYQPFRLLDEIDIYMDHEKRNSSLEMLYENTSHYSSSQHIILTPQDVDSQYWSELDVPVFHMPSPKRYNQEL